MKGNRLYFGDNLHVLRAHLPSESVDLVYLDPPFNSNATYNILFRGLSGHQSQAQIEAFDDTWHWGPAAAEAYDDVMRSGLPVADLLKMLRSFLRENDMVAYLSMMAARLIELHRVLKPTGSLYLHCDPTASHYLKIVLDGIFGPYGFRSEISWKRSSAHNDAKQGRKQYGNIRDIIFFYSKNANEWTWNWQYTPYDDSYIEQFYRFTEPETGRRYRLGDLTGPGGEAKGNPKYDVLGVTRYWRYKKAKMESLLKEGRIVQTRPGTVPQYKRYLDEMPGVPLQNNWDDIRPIGAQSRERLGYPTQKPLSLLERIINASSNPGDVILDPFCGCGTAVHAAEKLGRSWTGIDITFPAIQIINDRLKYHLPAARYDIFGIPVTVEDASALATLDKFQFEFWAVALVGGHSRYGRSTGDYGIDGQFYFKLDAKHDGMGLISVKGGRNLNPSMVRDLRGTLEREHAEMAVLITMANPSEQMKAEAASAGFFESSQGRHARLQIRTIADLLAGRGIDCPLQYTTVTMAHRGKEVLRYEQKRMAIDPEQLLKQRTLLLPISGGRAVDRHGQGSLPIETPQSQPLKRRKT